MRFAIVLTLSLMAPIVLACNLHNLGARVVAKQTTTNSYWVTPGVSGAWYNPARSGEGWIVEMLPNGVALVVWFTYAPGNEAAGQRWIVAANGQVSGNKITFTQSDTFRGGVFGPTFNPALVRNEPWGTMTFEFDDCGKGRVSYSGRDGYGGGAQPIVKLYGLHEASCDGGRVLTSSGSRAQAGLKNISGTWFDPTHDGEGLFVQAFNATQAVVTWFTYSPTGEPVWLVGVGTLDAQRRLRVAEMNRPVGTRFGAGFDPAAVRSEAWGSLELQFTACNRATLSYTSALPGYGNGGLALQTLTRAAGAVCVDSFAPANITGSWSAGATQPQPSSEVATAVIDNDIYVAGNLPGGRAFQRYSVSNNAWTVLPSLPGGRDHALMVADANALWLFGGYRVGPDATSHGWRFAAGGSTFEPIGNELAGSVAASGAVAMNGWYFLGDVDGALIQFDPRSGASRRLPPPSAEYRDHAAMVSYLGEIWLIAGRLAQGQNIATVSIYDPASERWRPGPSVLEARSGFGAAVVGDQILLAGGERLTGNRIVINSMEVIAAGEARWSSGPPLPTAVHGVGAAAVGGRLYMLGGSTRAGIANNPGVLQIYQPAP